MALMTYKDKLLSAIKELSEDKIAEVIDFIEYLKVKEKVKSKEITEFDKWAEKVAKEKGFSGLSEDDIMEIILEYRKEKSA